MNIQNYLPQHSSGVGNLALQPLPLHIHIRHSPPRTKDIRLQFSVGPAQEMGELDFLKCYTFSVTAFWSL